VNGARSETQPPTSTSVTAVIADGASLALSNLSVLLIPLLLDLYYLVGWRVTLGPIADRIEGSITNTEGSWQSGMTKALEEVGTWDILGVMSIFVPSFLSGSDKSEVYQPFGRNSIEVSSLLVAVLVIGLALLVSSVAYAVFGPWLADLAIDRKRTWDERLRLVPRTSFNVFTLMVLMAGAFVLVNGPLLLIWGIGAVAGVDLEGLILPFIVLLSVAILALFYFAPEALVVSDISAKEAMKRSAAVVRKNLGDALLFAGASVVLSIGLAELGDRIASSVPGVLLAVIGNAFVGCALALASMVFFFQRWQTMSQST
jgi:hypothetical protein